jgi:glutathione S-transferase
VQLFYSPNSPYARKARIIIHELDLVSRVEETSVSLPADAKLRSLNPLGKIPALLLDDGSVIYDSPVICEYLDDLGQGQFFPRAGFFREAQGRWRALTLQALGDGLADAVVRRNQEMRLSEEKRSPEVLARQTAAIEAAFAVANRAAVKFPAEPTIGEIAIACAIGYLDLRVPFDGWRDRYPQLAGWLEVFSQRPSAQATKPPPA